MKVGRHLLVAVAGISALALNVPALAQQTDPNGILSTYANAQTNWQNVIAPYALNLFKLLAIVDFSWTCIVIALEKQDAQAMVAAIIKKLMTIGAFYALLVFAPTWFPTIIQSFVQIGSAASGQPTVLSPSGILTQGLQISAVLFDGAGQTNLLTNPASTLVLIIAALVVLLSYLAICIHYIMAMVESYIVIGAGYIFLGFGGSRWTSSYVERYVSLVVSVGARLMVLYLVIGIGSQWAAGWVTQAQNSVLASAGVPDISLLWNLMCQVAIYGIVCWIVPKLAGSMIGGTLSVSGGDAIGMGVAAGTAAFATAATAAAVASGVGAPAAALTGAGAVSSVASAAGATGAMGGASLAGSTAAGSGASSAAATILSSAGGAAGFSGAGTAGAGAASASGLGLTAAAGVLNQPPPPASAVAASSAGSGGGAGSAGPASPSATAAPREVIQPPPPASAFEGSPRRGGVNAIQQTLERMREGVQSVHRSLPPDGGTISGANPSLSHGVD